MLLKRQINIEDGNLLNVQDVNLVTNDDLLKPYLNVNADNQMKTIVESIQKKQNNIIIRPTNEDMIIQGVAGSGKTSVALHRIAYLVYNSTVKDVTEDFLVLGPNECFLDYISSILPSLDTDPVRKETLLTFLNNYIEDELKIKKETAYSPDKKAMFNKNEAYKSSLEYKDLLEQLKKKSIGFEDISALLFINNKMTGKTFDYNNIVIDEAQDYGLFHFYTLKQICLRASFNIYGDLAQAIYSYKSIKSWDDVNRYIFDNKCNILNLCKSYRTTIEITNNANNILEQLYLNPAEPVVRHGIEVNFANSSNDEQYKLDLIKTWISKGYHSIAIICKTEKEAKEVQKNYLHLELKLNTFQMIFKNMKVTYFR